MQKKNSLNWSLCIQQNHQGLTVCLTSAKFIGALEPTLLVAHVNCGGAHLTWGNFLFSLEGTIWLSFFTTVTYSRHKKLMTLGLEKWFVKGSWRSCYVQDQLKEPFCLLDGLSWTLELIVLAVALVQGLLTGPSWTISKCISNLFKGSGASQRTAKPFDRHMSRVRSKSSHMRSSNACVHKYCMVQTSTKSICICDCSIL